MNLSNLKPAVGSRTKRKRIGRGQGSGRGGTSTRGHNGQQSRSGYKRKYNAEGGQMPLQMRLPKFGFKNINRIFYKVVNLNILENLASKGINEFDLSTFIDNGLANKKSLIKILSKGELKSKINITAHAFSGNAKKNIEAIGGKAVLINKK